jgi:hypothetical protein
MPLRCEVQNWHTWCDWEINTPPVSASAGQPLYVVQGIQRAPGTAAMGFESEALLLNGQPIGGRTQVRNDVDPVLVRRGNGRSVGFEVGDLTLGANDHRVGRVRNPARNPSVFRLCERKCRGQEKRQD